ncbi:MAG TPA: cyclic nucleotide-binding domain-containing protein [Burkholderiales bacterium]|nr:cyclic nucleotide-binding domain-containing protein [Burkholderiales bacterium]
MDSLDFTQPSHSPVYDARAAAEFFEHAGKAETVAAGKPFFTEHAQRGFFSGDDRMYLLVEGSVALTVGGRPLDTVKAGEIFGEMATITNAKRSATATAKTDCRVIGLDSAQFQKAIRRSPEFVVMLMSIMIDRLRLTLARLTMLKALPDRAASEERRLFDEKTINALAHKLGDPPPVEFPAGRPVIKTGDPAVRMYIVRKGRVAIVAGNRTLEQIGPGGVFGEMALVDRGTRTANAVATTDCALLSVNREQFLDLVKGNPEFGLSLLKMLGQRLQAVSSAAQK